MFVASVKLNESGQESITGAKNDKLSVLNVHIELESRVQLQSGVTLVHEIQSSDLYRSNNVQDEYHGTSNDKLKYHPLKMRDAHSAHAFIVWITKIQVQISLHVAASDKALSTRLGGNNIPFQDVDQLTVILVQEIVRVHVI